MTMYSYLCGCSLWTTSDHNLRLLLNFGLIVCGARIWCLTVFSTHRLICSLQSAA